MLSFLLSLREPTNEQKCINEVITIATALFEDIEKTYRHDLLPYKSIDVHGNEHQYEGVVCYPMQFLKNYEGVSSKPHHHNAFELGTAAYQLAMHLKHKNFENLVPRKLAILKNFQSEENRVKDSTLPLILDKFDANRLKLILACEKLMGQKECHVDINNGSPTLLYNYGNHPSMKEEAVLEQEYEEKSTLRNGNKVK